MCDEAKVIIATVAFSFSTMIVLVIMDSMKTTECYKAAQVNKNITCKEHRDG